MARDSSSSSGSGGSGNGAKSGSVDLWADLPMACFVISVVLAPPFFFRVKSDAQRTASSSSASHRKSPSNTALQELCMQQQQPLPQKGKTALAFSPSSLASNRPIRSIDEMSSSDKQSAAPATPTQAAAAGAIAGGASSVVRIRERELCMELLGTDSVVVVVIVSNALDRRATWYAQLTDAWNLQPLGAACAGCVLVTYIIFQVQQAPISKKAHGKAKYVTFVQSIKSIHGEEGLKSFWRGNLAATGLWVSYSAIQFGCYRSLNGLWSTNFQERHGTTVSTLNGALSGVVATAVTYPLDLFRTIFASQGVPKQFPTMQSLVAHTWATRGMPGFYSGLSATLFQIAPYMGLSFGIYSSLNTLAATKMDMTHSSGLAVGLSYVGTGAVAGLLSKLTVYPLDTLKKRMQMRQVPRCASYGVIPHYESSWQCLRDILKKEGVRGLYKGTTPSLIKSVVTHSSTFATYEVALVALQKFSADVHENVGDKHHQRYFNSQSER